MAMDGLATRDPPLDSEERRPPDPTNTAASEFVLSRSISCWKVDVVAFHSFSYPVVLLRYEFCSVFNGFGGVRGDHPILDSRFFFRASLLTSNAGV